MREVGIRQLKASLSEVIRAVQTGESIRVTNHGKPVADIVPPQATSFEDRLNELISQGRVRAPLRSGHAPAPTPLRQPAGSISGSDEIIADRESERDH